mmetsp:Transcript_58865/g.53029  ORF Transcript_58865/g.53029 Transcript_58865/m.53029 type:complete len:274 (+) Transcript_58865:87-908(+)
MERFLIKKRKRSDAFEELKDDESHLNESVAEQQSAKKKRRIDPDFVESSSDYDPDEEEDIDVEKNTQKNTNNKKEDSEVTKLRIALREMTKKYNKMKLENDKLKKKIKTTPAKGASKNKKVVDASKIKKKYLKKWATRLPKVSAMKKTKFLGSSKEIIIEEMGFDREEFDAIFGDKGYLVQPRPDNKPTSTVIIRQFSTWDSINALFGEYGLTEEIIVSIWRQRNFSKSRYCGEGTAKISELNACYNKSRKVLQLKFQCERDYYGGTTAFFLW